MIATVRRLVDGMLEHSRQDAVAGHRVDDEGRALTPASIPSAGVDDREDISTAGQAAPPETLASAARIRLRERVRGEVCVKPCRPPQRTSRTRRETDAEARVDDGARTAAAGSGFFA